MTQILDANHLEHVTNECMFVSTAQKNNQQTDECLHIEVMTMTMGHKLRTTRKRNNSGAVNQNENTNRIEKVAGNRDPDSGEDIERQEFKEAQSQSSHTTNDSKSHDEHC